jgi:hypothetical protein
MRRRTRLLRLGSTAVCVHVLLFFGCSDDAPKKDSAEQGTSSSSSSSSGGTGAPTASTSDRCRFLCDQTGAQCGPNIFKTGERYSCKDLCTELLAGGGSCATKLGQFVDCALPTNCSGLLIPSQDPAPLPPSCTELSCEKKITPCSPATANDECADSYAGFLASHGIELDAGPVKTAVAECNKVCKKRSEAGCPLQDCELGCSLYPQTPKACQDAAIAEATCFLDALDVCARSPCTAVVQARLKACQ